MTDQFESAYRTLVVPNNLVFIGYLDADDPNRPPFVMPNQIVEHWPEVYVRRAEKDRA